MIENGVIFSNENIAENEHALRATNAEIAAAIGESGLGELKIFARIGCHAFFILHLQFPPACNKTYLM